MPGLNGELRPDSQRAWLQLFRGKVLHFFPFLRGMHADARLGMSDYYRDRVRHGGILSNAFVARWWNRQVITNQHGLAGRAARTWGDDTLEGDLPADALEQNRRDQTIDTAEHVYRDDDYFASKDFNLGDIEVPLLSVANWVRVSICLFCCSTTVD